VTRADDKAELFALVQLLHERGWTTPTIARVLDFSDDRIRDVLTDLGLHSPVRFLSVLDAIQSLDDPSAQRVLAFRQSGIPT
jgi:hypothetical protein